MEGAKEKHTPRAIKERRHWVTFWQMLTLFGIGLGLCGLSGDRFFSMPRFARQFARQDKRIGANRFQKFQPAMLADRPLGFEQATANLTLNLALR